MGETPMLLSNTPCQSPLKQRAVARRVFKLPPKVVHPENSKPWSKLSSPLRIITGQLALFRYEKSAHWHLKSVSTGFVACYFRRTGEFGRPKRD
jgi:hypothetical protein